MEEMKSRVYVLLDGEIITRIEGEYSLPADLEGWTLIEEGTPCDRLNHAQGNYFPKPLVNMDGTHNYYYEDDAWREATESELQAELSSFPAPLPTPQEDTDAMLVDLELRLSLLEMGV